LPVIFYHAGLSLFSGGFVGVDIFFVISGYLITTIIINELRENRFSIINFYERRARRILPALFMVILACLPFTWFLLPPLQAIDFSQSLIGVATFSSNILFWRETGYFEAASELKPLIHTWSLAIEEQFYVIFPAFMIFVWRYGEKVVYGAIIVTALISLILADLLVSQKASAAFFLLPTRGWELLMGCLLTAIPNFSSTYRILVLRNIMCCLGLLLILGSIFLFDSKTPTPSFYTLLPTIGAALVISFGGHNVLVSKALSVRILVGIGLISYSLYLWHQPVLAFWRLKFESMPGSTSLAAIFTVTSLLALFTWRYVERPFREVDKFPRPHIFYSSAFGLILICMVGLLGFFSDGFNQSRLSSHQQDLFSTASHSPYRDQCHAGISKSIAPQKSCLYGTSSKTIAVFGDSHVVELSYALSELSRDEYSVGHYSFSGCYPAYSRKFIGLNPACENWSQETVDYIIADPNIDTVVVSYRLPFALYGFGEAHNEYPKIIDYLGADERKNRWDSLINILNSFRNANKKIILVLPAPELPRDIGFLIMTQVASDHIRGAPLDFWKDRMSFVYENINSVPDDVEIIDAADLLCDRDICFAAEQTTAYYFDDNHLSLAGAKLIADEIYHFATNTN